MVGASWVGRGVMGDLCHRKRGLVTGRLARYFAVLGENMVVPQSAKVRGQMHRTRMDPVMYLGRKKAKGQVRTRLKSDMVHLPRLAAI